MSKKVVTFGEVMMRLSSPGFAKFAQANSAEISYGGAEANVGISLAYFGMNACHVTQFPNNFIGKAATQYLRHHWIDTSKIKYGSGDLGKYFLEKGAVHRSSEIVYEREHSAFSHVQPDTFDWEEILKDADWFHWTGITPGISLGVAEACMEAIRVANKLGVTVSADLFSRNNQWKYGKRKQDVLAELAAGCDVVIASPFDMEDIFGIPNEDDQLATSATKLMQRFPRIKKVFNKNRDSLNASHNRIQGRMFDGKKEYTAPAYDLTHIVDRVGTGDAFAAGMIYGLLNFTDDELALKYAAAACALKHTIEGDANLVSVDDVQKLVDGNTSGRIKR
jgi:2-dehydro-3-deoxygluconokinase